MALPEVGVRFVAEDFDKFRATMRQADSAIKNFGASTSSFAKQAESNFKRVNTSSAQLGNSLRSTGQQFSKFGSSLPTGEFPKLTDSAQKASSAFSSLAGSLPGISSGLGGIGGALVLATTGLVAAVNVAGDFEQAIDQVGATAGANSQQLEDLANAARENASASVFTATEAAQGLGFLSQAGFSVEQSIQGLPATLNLAAAGGLALADAADIASNVLTPFRLEASELTRVADVLATTADNSNTNVSQLGEAFSFAAPDAAALGLSIEETAAFLGIFSNNGIQASRSGTTLRGTLAALKSPTAEASALFDDLGIDLFDVSGNFVGAIPAIEQISAALEGLTQEDRVGAIETIFGRIAGTGAGAALSQTGDLTDLLNKNLESNGAAADKAAERIDNFRGQLALLNSTIQDIGISIGNQLIPSLTQATQTLNVLLGGGDTSTIDSQLERIQQSSEDFLGSFAGGAGELPGVGNLFTSQEDLDNIIALRQAIQEVEEAQKNGVEGASLYAQELDEIARNAILFGVSGGEVSNRVDEISNSVTDSTQNIFTMNSAFDQAKISGASAFQTISQEAVATSSVVSDVAATITSALSGFDSAISGTVSSLESQVSGIVGLVGSDRANEIFEQGVATVNEAAVSVQRQIDSGAITQTQGRFQLQEQTQQAFEPVQGILDAEQDRKNLIAEQSREEKRLLSEREREQKRLASEQERNAKAVESAWIAAAESTEREFENALGGVEGLFGASETTQEQLDLADAGIPQNFADDFLRQARDELINGVDRINIDRGDLEERLASSTAFTQEQLSGLGNDLFLGVLEDAFNTQELFSDVRNLELINLDAVAEGLEEQSRQAEGQDNLTSFLTQQLGDVFGIDERQLAAFNESGLNISTSIAQGAASESALAQAAEAGQNIANAAVSGLTGQSIGGEGAGQGVLPTAGDGAGFDLETIGLTPEIGSATQDFLTDEILAPEQEIRAENRELERASLSTRLSNAEQTSLQINTTYQSAFITAAELQTAASESLAESFEELQDILSDLVGVTEEIGGTFENIAESGAEANQALFFVGESGIMAADAFNQINTELSRYEARITTSIGLLEQFNNGLGGGGTPPPANPLPLNATGTRFFQGGFGIGGEEGPELAIGPRGNIGLLGLSGAEIFNAAAGTTIYTATETNRILRGGNVAPSNTRILNRQSTVSNSSADTTNSNNMYTFNINDRQISNGMLNDQAAARILGALI